MKRIGNPRFYEVYFFFLLFTFSDGFGLRGDGAWGGIGNGSFGPFGLLQLSLMAFNIYMLTTSRKIIFANKSKLSESVKIYLLLYIFIIFQLVFQSLLDFSKFSKFAHLIRLKDLLLIFSIPIIYKEIGTKGIVKILKVCGVVSSVIALYVILMQVDGTAFKMMVGEDATRALRIMVPTAPIIVLGYFMFLSSYKQTKNSLDLICALPCFLASFIQLHRTTTFALLIVTVLFVIIELRLNIVKISLFFIAILALLFFVFSAVDYSFDMLEAFFTSSLSSEEADKTKTSIRVGLLINGFQYVVSNYIIIGIGMDWDLIEDTFYYRVNQFAHAPTGDCGYFNIIIVFGVLGLFLFFRMLAMLLMNTYKCKNARDKEVFFTILSIGLFYDIVYTAIVSYGGDHIFNSLVFFIVIGLALMNDQTCFPSRHLKRKIVNV